MDELLRCGYTCDLRVGSKPWWMGEYQYACYCKLPPMHDGECKCSHMIGNDND